ncbi:adenylate/guanylate cyclase domain-containing protein [uncultured Aquimarina sp.]|uniref:adenylate/guanylate cyclase domain-containing protein n=1 Tax=uncultured Aquimarina sp. TaxID=575652 RepID=UPI0026178D2B|nr:adenylate/guanylate cyclase domain-containing protein [uncultured Aquimarina sp.]
MNTHVKTYLKQLAYSVMFWGLCLAFFAVFRYLGINRIPEITTSVSVKSLVYQNLIALTAVGVILGIVYATIDFFFDKHLSKSLSLGANLILRALIYFIITILLLRFSQKVAEANGIKLNFEKGWFWWLKDERFLSILLYIAFCSFFFLLMKIAAERFGKGVFLKILRGRYRIPKEEERIFMFLDLKDSTTIAEKLGHLKYSQFIQDCFYDLNMVVSKYEAEIYQYVGDEAVLTWPYAKGVKNNNCIKLFYDFKEQQKSRKDYYYGKYEVYPEFKAGLHGGPIMVAEVGFVKKELAYHGDIINTSARIQAQCNTYNVFLLLSDKLILDMNTEYLLKPKTLGSVLLKGKQEEVTIYTLV